MKAEEEIINDINKLEEETINEACKLLSAYNKGLKHYLACLVASLCGVSVGDLYTNTKHIGIIQSRWLFWYAYRYMTNESYESISRNSSEWRHFGSACVGQSVTKMAMMISQDDIWSKRWAVLKRMIKIMLRNTSKEQDLFQTPITIKVVYPKNVNVELKSE